MNSKKGNQGQGTPSTPVAFYLVKLDLIFFSQGRVEGGPLEDGVAENVLCRLGHEGSPPWLDCRRKILNLAPLKRFK